MMRALAILSLVVLATAEIKLEHALKEPASPTKEIETLETLKKFVKLVDEKKLNVSVVVSSSKAHEDGNLKSAIALSVSFPPNEEKLTASTLTLADAKEILKHATEDKLPAQALFSKASSISGVANNLEAVPSTVAHRLVTEVDNTETELDFDRKHHDAAAQWTIFSPGADGKNTTTKILWQKLQVHVIKQQGFDKEGDLKIVESAVKSAFFMYEIEDGPRVVSVILDKELPGNNWQVSAVGGEENYIDSKKWILIEVRSQKYLIFALD